MRVLMINRSDARSHFGGDVMQMDRTAAHLAELGVKVEIQLGEQTSARMAEFDLIHLFNLQTFRFTHSQMLTARESQRPIALSTIWWDFRADDVMVESPKWRKLTSLFGAKVVRPWVQKRIIPIVQVERQFHRDLIRGVDVLLPNSDSETQQLRALTSFDTPVHVIPNGVDSDGEQDMEEALAHLNAHGVEPGEYILIAARVEPVKNQLAYCRAVKSLGIPVVCAGAKTEPYASAVAAEGAILLGRVELPVLRGLYLHAKIHALPSFRETPGLASLEAGSYGIRLVSTDVGSARDYFGDRVEYCDPHSAASMLRATQRAISRQADNEHAILIRARYTWKRAAEKTLAAYEAVLRQ